ncbi:MAG: hypothetical protein J5858_14445 [Lentisphaeria bacterium]|nr:hypothetical protein [Lentisphaeria bacterium]
MARTFWTKEQKAEFWAAFVIHRDAGCSKKEAYRLACADIKAIGKAVPGLATFAHWYEKAMHAVRGPMDDAAGERPAPANTEPEATAESEMDDYTARLKMMVLLYRRRSESDCDAVCDRLLPELNHTETEEE